MRLLNVTTAAVLVTWIASPASGQPPAPDVRTPSGVQASQPDEIVVTGRRDSRRYRLAPQFRTAAGTGDRWRRSFAHDWSCRNVGPRGCGLQPDRLITVGSDGSVQFGDHRSAE